MIVYVSAPKCACCMILNSMYYHAPQQSVEKTVLHFLNYTTIEIQLMNTHFNLEIIFMK